MSPVSRLARAGNSRSSRMGVGKRVVFANFAKYFACLPKQAYGQRVTDHQTPLIPRDLPTTLGALRTSGHEHRNVKDELRENLVEVLRRGDDPFPGVVGIEDTVRPQLERAILAGHDLVLLGERGQGKTRLLRTMIGLLDEWTPVIEGSELNEHPYEPISVWAKRRVAELGDETPVSWLHRSQRYNEKLATPDTSVGDLIGDVDPVKVAEGRTLGDPETVHYGLVPRTNRGIFAINELPDLAERIQVSLLNVLEERDIQVRGYALRLPLDLMLVASANPEVALIRQEAAVRALVPAHLLEVVARFTRLVRESTAVDARSGVSARFAVAAAESLAASALRRAAITGETAAVARVGDLPGVVPTLRGKVEFEVSEEGREEEILIHLQRRAVAETFRAHLGGVDLSALIARIDEGDTIEVGDLVTAESMLNQLGPVDGLGRIVTALEGESSSESPGLVASALETALEGLYLTRRISKDEVPGGGRAVYGGA